MPNVHTRPEPPEAPCPVCGEMSTAAALRIDNGIHTADFRDAAGHIWTTRWMVPA